MNLAEGEIFEIICRQWFIGLGTRLLLTLRQGIVGHGHPVHGLLFRNDQLLEGNFNTRAFQLFKAMLHHIVEDIPIILIIAITCAEEIDGGLTQILQMARRGRISEHKAGGKHDFHQCLTDEIGIRFIGDREGKRHAADGISTEVGD